MVVYTHMSKFFKNVVGTDESFQQCHVYNDIHVNSCFAIEKGKIMVAEQHLSLANVKIGHLKKLEILVQNQSF